MSLPAIYASIFPATGVPSQTVELKIGGKIRLFRDVLLTQMELRQSDSDENVWWLEFFPRSDYAQCFQVVFEHYSGAGALPKRSQDALAALAYVVCPKEDDSLLDEFLESACDQTSLYLRGSRAVKSSQLYEASTHHGFVDGRGAQYISKIDNVAQFKRHVLLHALAYAYMLTMEKLGDRLSLMLPGRPGCESDLRQHYKDVALFNAKSFFHQPVKFSHGPTCDSWRRIDKALGIHVTNEELSRQVQSAHDIYSLDAEKLAAARLQEKEAADTIKAQRDEKHQRQLERSDQRRNWWLGVVGVLVALASAPGVIDLAKSLL